MTECEMDCGKTARPNDVYCSDECLNAAYAEAQQYAQWLREGNDSGWPLGVQQPDGSYKAS